jgi:type IV pilus assembly protein PilM
LAEKSIKSKVVNVCAPGFHVFSKFVKLPPVDSSKVTQIIQYEAQQNVPFPLEEVVWDYQILGSAPSGELEVLLVAIKADIIEGLFRVTEAAGLHLQLADVSPAALCNAFRYNYGELEDCTMLLDIGAKTSNLLFFEKGKVFSRSINLGAQSITQDFATESKLKWDAAEKLKIDEGFVSLGGAYEEPENQHQAAISKIARQFMTRLHIQVNQTLQFYRGQQGGSAPVRLFLSGGASIMPYTAQFFAEKLNVPVEYFNPLRNVQIDPGINLEDLARVAHSLGEVVGLGLRNLAHCPVELNLMPESTLSWQRFNQKKPYFIASVFSLVAVVAAVGLLFDKLAGLKRKAEEQLQTQVQPAQQKSERFKQEYQKLNKAQKDAAQLVEYLNDRYYWDDVMGELRQVLMRAQSDMDAKLHTYNGIWIDQFITAAQRPAGEETTGGTGAAPTPSPAGSAVETDYMRKYRERYNLVSPGAPEPATRLPAAETPPGGAAPSPDATGAVAAAPKKARSGNTNEVSSIKITFRAISRSKVSPSANTDIAYEVINQIRSSPLFDPEDTTLSPQISADEPPGTFTFVVDASLKRPLKL